MVASATGLRVETDERHAENHCGAWVGKLRAEIAHHYPEVFATREWFFGAPGGETFEDVSARAADWLDSLPPEPDRRVIAVSHGVWGRIARGVYGGLDRQTTLNQDVPQDAVFRLQNGQIDRFDCEPVD
jgi:probable phosphoglycerate mutase